MDNSNVNIDLIRDHVDTIILSTLANGDRYGLDILTEIKEKSQGLYILKQPTLYSCLKRLEKLGYITSYKGDTSNGAQRVYYSLLDDGRNFLLKDQYQWEYSRTIINGLLSDKAFDPKAEPPFNASDLRPRTKRQSRSDDEPHGAYATLKDTETPIILNDTENQNSVVEQSQMNLQPTEISPVNTENEQPIQQNGQTIKFFGNNDYKTVIVNKDSVIYEQNVDYVGVLGDIFSPDNKFIESVNKQQDEYYSHTSSMSRDYNSDVDDYASQYAIENIQKKFEEEGFILKPYYKKNTTEFYVNKYLYINKILMASSAYAYILFALAMCIMHFSTCAAFNTNISSLLIPLAIIAICPIYCALNYVLNPTKKILANFSLKKTMSLMSIFMINAFLIVIIVGFIGFGANFSNPATLVKPVIFPIIAILLIPCAILIYSWLYSTTRYHVN